MIPGPDQVLQCPACDAAMLQPTIRSGNTLDAVHYTDGYMDAPMLPQPAALVRCPACREPLVRRHAKLLGEVDRFGVNLFPEERAASAVDPAWRRAPRVEAAHEPDYVAALATHRLPREDEIELRVELMHVCNHARRRLPPHATPPPVSALEQANLRKLAALLDLRDGEERRLLAEVRRELGDFDAASSLLAGDFPEEVGPAAQRIRQLVADRHRWVSEVFAGEE
jgi:hypothetical protein